MPSSALIVIKKVDLSVTWRFCDDLGLKKAFGSGPIFAITFFDLTVLFAASNPSELCPVIFVHTRPRRRFHETC